MSTSTGVECKRDIEQSHWSSAMGVGAVGRWTGRQEVELSYPQVYT